MADVAVAAGALGQALAGLGEAYEHLDEQAADRLEEGIFRPLQSAYGRLNRVQAEFAQRYSLAVTAVAPTPVPAPDDPRRLFERAADAIQSADDTLAELQDSLLPVEVGDEALRTGLSEVRVVISPLPSVSAQLVRTLGR